MSSIAEMMLRNQAAQHRAMAMSQQALGYVGLSQLAALQYANSGYRNTQGKIETIKKIPSCIREEMQNETDDWLKDAL